jgi:hypothetical protein
MAILLLLERLEVEAAAAGGRVLSMNGNHETMSVAGDFRYVDPGGCVDTRVRRVCVCVCARRVCVCVCVCMSVSVSVCLCVFGGAIDVLSSTLFIST